MDHRFYTDHLLITGKTLWRASLAASEITRSRLRGDDTGRRSLCVHRLDRTSAG